MKTARSKWNQKIIYEMRNTGDELADKTVDEIAADGDIEKINDMLQHLVSNSQELPPQLPQHMKDYLNRSDDLPKWIDWELIEIGQKAFEDYALETLVILGCASLPEDYVLEDATRVLGRTQRLEGHVPRRIWETGIFLFDTMSSGGLGKEGKGLRSAQRVRLMHAAVRHLLLKETPAEVAARDSRTLSDEMLKFTWDESYGAPINQTAMAAAYLSFSYIVIKCLKKMGEPITNEQVRGWLHCWNVIASVMGVKNELLLDRPESMSQAEELYNLIWQSCRVPPNAAEDLDDGRELSHALIDWMAREMSKRSLGLLHDFPRTMTQFFIGSRNARQLGVELDWNDRIVLKVIKSWAKVKIWTRGGLFNNVPLLDEGVDRLKMNIFEQIFKQDRNKDGGVFEMSDELAEKLGVGHIVRKYPRPASTEKGGQSEG